MSNQATAAPRERAVPVRSPKPSQFQPEIQGLRAVAVLAVVVYHLWPQRVTGGYVGVDVFFVISGYLITSHMYREVSKSGRVGLLQFWARRIRRLLPASICVLAVSLLGALLWLPSTVWEVAARQIGASALYVQNWALAVDAVDYSAMHNDATPVQHYWSLSVEEQFYVVWPLLLTGLLYVSRHLTARRQQSGTLPHGLPLRTTMAAGIAVVGAASLVYSIVLTAQSQSTAYFVTPTRVWEFAVGGLVALVFADRQFNGRWASVAAWTGLALIAVTSLAYDGATPFPGWTAALPVVGTALVLVCSGSTTAFAPRRWLSRRPMTFLGDVSYGLYLWHWPLIIFAPYVLGHTLTGLEKVLLLLLSVALAWVTKVSIEDPLRRGWLLRAPWRAYAFTAASMAAIVALCFGLTAAAYASPGDGEAAAKLGPCYGPGALAPANNCGPVPGKEAPRPGPALVAKQNTDPLYEGCQAGITASDVVSCDLGVSADQAKATVAIVGDSHATAWFPALDQLAAAKKWHVKTYTKSSCPATTARRIVPSETNEDSQRSCLNWNQKVDDALTADKSISIVFTAAYSTAYTFASPEGRTLKNPAVGGFEETWRSWMAAGKHVVAFDDVPRTNGEYVPTCLAKHQDDSLACAMPRAKAYPDNTAIGRAGAAMSREGVKQVTLREQFCDEKLCYPVVGSVIVYRDYSHISAEYSRALVPYISKQL
ncbi:acyltransferase family protein [Arthrobacter sp. Hor0625]|uniref:acyltransferase family protein n=1 Tax=Arthrobacter sp. Hor0625 TaxID=3457358 RepID=UPI00403E498A